MLLLKHLNCDSQDMNIANKKLNIYCHSKLNILVIKKKASFKLIKCI